MSAKNKTVTSLNSLIIAKSQANHQGQQKFASGRARYTWDGRVTITKRNARQNYERFFRQWYRTNSNEWLSIGRLFKLPSLKVEILGLNSSALQQRENHFAGLGKITSAAFKTSAGFFGWNKEQNGNTLRILAVHHHLLPVLSDHNPSDAKKGFGIALDAGNQLIQATQYGVDLILHGHQHQPYVGFVKCEMILGDALNGKGLLVLGAGSAGVVSEYLGPIGQRCINLIDVTDRQISVELLTTHSNSKEFRRHSRIRANLGEPWQRE